jgi:hypothetical protein
MWNKAFIALALAVPTLACGDQQCVTDPSYDVSSQYSGSISLTFDAASLAANANVTTLDEGTIDVVGFRLYSATVEASDAFKIEFRANIGTVISCETTLTKLAASPSTLSDLCDASLTVGPATQPYGEHAVGAEVYALADLGNVASVVTSSVATDSNGIKTVSLTVDIAPMTLTAWTVESACPTCGGAPTPGAGNLQLGATHLAGSATLNAPTTRCFTPSSSGNPYRGWGT